MSNPIKIFVEHEIEKLVIKIFPKEKEIDGNFIEFNYEDSVLNEEFTVNLPINMELFARFYLAFLFFQDMVSKSSEYGNVDLREGIKKYNIPGTTLTLITDKDGKVNPNDDYFEFEFLDDKTGYKTSLYAVKALGKDEFAIYDKNFCCGCPVKEGFHKVFRDHVLSDSIEISKA